MSHQRLAENMNILSSEDAPDDARIAAARDYKKVLQEMRQSPSDAFADYLDRVDRDVNLLIWVVCDQDQRRERVRCVALDTAVTALREIANFHAESLHRIEESSRDLRTASAHGGILASIFTPKSDSTGLEQQIETTIETFMSDAIRPGLETVIDVAEHSGDYPAVMSQAIQAARDLLNMAHLLGYPVNPEPYSHRLNAACGVNPPVRVTQSLNLFGFGS